MKHIKLLALMMVLLTGFSACDNEVDLTADFRDIPIVYGMLTSMDSVQYIRIQKGFLPEDGESALDVALNADSLYYDENLDVRLERDDTGNSYVLTRIDGVAEGITRAEGIFANQPNYLYKLELPPGETLVVDRSYTLRINRGDNKPEITASTKIVGDVRFSIPSQPGQINIRYRTYAITWREAKAAAFYDVKMEIFFLEELASDPGTFVEKSVIWNIRDGYSSNSGSANVSYEIDGEGFYRFLGATLEETGFDRTFKSLDFIVDAGGETLFDYINIGQANTGITSSQIIPTYSNLSEGFGVLSSRSRFRFEGFTLVSESRDSLADGIYTRDLGF